MNTKPNRDITAEEPTTSTEWVNELQDMIAEYKYDRLALYIDVKEFVENLLTTRTNELLGGFKMDKRKMSYSIVVEGSQEHLNDMWGLGYNRAVDEFNEKLATLRDKYSV